MFTQLFTVLGIVTKHNKSAALPFVYALLSSKETLQYSAVLHAVTTAAEEYNIRNCKPEKIMTDFEQGIINAGFEVFNCDISCCFFHLGQSLYRRIQSEGLQGEYQDPLNNILRTQTHMILALAFVPVNDIPAVFKKLNRFATPMLTNVLQYFERNYIGIPARGRRAAVNPLYPPALWNQRDAALNGNHKTNNISEGWHNRFRLLIGKNHPDMYSFLTEVQKEQGDTEIAVTELCLGRAVKAAPKKKWIQYQIKIQNIANDYINYKNAGNELEFLELMGSNIIL